MIGFTSTTFKEKTIDEVIAFAVSSKAECIEWGQNCHITDVETAKEVREKCSKHGIDCTSYGSYFRIGEGDITQTCMEAQALGARTVRVWIGKKGSQRTSNDEFNKLVAHARECADIAAGYGLVLSGECHPHTYNDNLKCSLKFLSQVDKANFKTYFQSLYRDMTKDINRFNATVGSVTAVHLSFSEVERMQRFRRKNNTCIEMIVDQIKALDFKGDVLLEFANDALGDMQKLYRLMREED